MTKPKKPSPQARALAPVFAGKGGRQLTKAEQQKLLKQAVENTPAPPDEKEDE
jgi:hypothetical protein